MLCRLLQLYVIIAHPNIYITNRKYCRREKYKIRKNCADDNYLITTLRLNKFFLSKFQP